MEIAFNPVFGNAGHGVRPFAGSSLELEYGVNAWWTSELYLDAEKSGGDGGSFSGYRIENRFRLLASEYSVNPVLYLEYADVTGADKVFREIVGFDSWRDQQEPAADLRHEKKRELEAKLILSSDVRGWNISENLIAEKNLNGSPIEFGYAVGASRPLAMAESPIACSLCRENFALGVEMYGGFGERHQVTLSGTSHYVAPAISWSLPQGLTLRFSPSIGINGNSHRALLRFGVSYDIPAFGRFTMRSAS